MTYAKLLQPSPGVDQDHSGPGVDQDHSGPGVDQDHSGPGVDQRWSGAAPPLPRGEEETHLSVISSSGQPQHPRPGRGTTMDSDDESIEETVEGPLDEEGQPHGVCTVIYSSSDRFEGHFIHGEKNGKGKFFFFDGSTLEGFYVDDALQGPGTYSYEDGGLLQGTYLGGELNGPAQEYDGDGRLVFRGQYRDNNRWGKCWVYYADGGCIFGEVNVDGEMTGESMAYIYPNSQTALYGSFVEGEVIGARLATLVSAETGGTHFDIATDSPVYSYDKSTSTCIATHLLLPDPYESQRVFVADSLIKGAGQGLFAKMDAESDTVMAFYNGVRITHSEVDGRDWAQNGNTISLDEYTVIDVPQPYDQTERYCASLGHKANHSFTPNSKYDPFVHPRFGQIKCVRTLRAVQKDEELTVAYGYDHNSAGSGPEAPDWYKQELEALQLAKVYSTSQ